MVSKKYLSELDEGDDLAATLIRKFNAAER